MAKGLITHAYLEDTADAIRVLRGESNTYTPDEFGEKIIDAIPTETASGNPIHITDAAAYPAESVITTLEPVQDLHGYTKPWPAGGGKNLLPITAESQTMNGVTFTVNKDSAGNVVSVTVNGTASDTTAFILTVNTQLSNGTYTISGCPANGSTATYLFIADNRDSSGSSTISSAVDVGSGDTLEITQGVCRAYIRIGQNVACNNLVFKPMIRLATVTDATFEPYSNECPISGHTGVELTRTGKNLLPSNKIVQGTIIASWNPTRCSTRNYKAIKVKVGDMITVSRQSGSVRYAIAVLRETDDYILYDSGWISDLSKTYTANFNGYFYLAFSFTNDENIIPADVVACDFQIEFGSAATAYEEAYTPETHSAAFPQAQSPVYGCDVDWVNGVLRVTEVSATYDGSADESWSNRVAATGANLFEITIQDMIAPESTLQIGKCNLFPWLITVATDKTYRLMGKILTVHYNDITLTEWKNMLAETPLQITYPLATPLEIPLTPEIITLLKGENNVWTNAGESEIEYKVDLNSYIQKLIAEASASTSALSVSPLSLGKSAVVSTDGEDGGEIKDVESVDEADEVEGEPAEDMKAEEDLTIENVKTLNPEKNNM